VNFCRHQTKRASCWRSR